MTVEWKDLLNSKGEFDIPPEKWSALNESMTKAEIIGLLNDAVDNTAMPFPFREMTLEGAVGDFCSLKFFNTGSITAESAWTSLHAYRYEKSNIVVGKSNVGMRSSNYFHRRHRYRCESNLYVASALRAWEDRTIRHHIFKPLWTMNVARVNSSEIRSCATMRTHVAPQFRPSVAKFIYDRFGGGRVLDFSSGWGDRLSAALATSSVTHYTGIDPNTNLHPGYQAQIEAYNRNVDGEVFDWFGSFTPKSIRMIESPAEDADLGNDTYDIVFTSPPYFDRERYSNSVNQSWKRYRTPDAWLSGFMYPVIKKVWDHLRPGGHLCINIADLVFKHQRISLCDPMNDYIGTMPGARYLGAIGMEMSSRPGKFRDGATSRGGLSYVNGNTLADVPAQVYEPIWIWRKES